MDKESFAKKGFVAGSAEGMKLTIEYLNPAYARPVNKPDVTTDDKGLLRLLLIEPLSAGLPSFQVRIGHDKPHAIDIDLKGQPEESKAFAGEAPGYIGHRTVPLNTNPPSYRLNIEIPLVGRVFYGILTLNTVGLWARLFDKF